MTQRPRAIPSVPANKIPPRSEFHASAPSLESSAPRSPRTPRQHTSPREPSPQKPRPPRLSAERAPSYRVPAPRPNAETPPEPPRSTQTAPPLPSSPPERSHFCPLLAEVGFFAELHQHSRRLPLQPKPPWSAARQRRVRRPKKIRAFRPRHLASPLRFPWLRKISPRSSRLTRRDILR